MFLFCSGLNATIERLLTEGCGRIKEGCTLREKGGMLGMAPKSWDI